MYLLLRLLDISGNRTFLSSQEGCDLLKNGTINGHNPPWEDPPRLHLFKHQTKALWHSNDTVAERLRRLTRNQLGLSRVGSSPASVACAFCSVRQRLTL